MATLEIVAGVNAGNSYDLTDEQTVIGRYQYCQVVLPVNTISRQHAHIVRVDDSFYIEDLNSLNGTFVNGAEIEERTPLHDQDSIQLYDTRITFHASALPEKREETPGELSETRAIPTSETASWRRRSPEILNTLDVSAELRLETGARVKLKAVLDITRILGSSLSLDEVLPKIVDGMFAVFPQIERGYILLEDEFTGNLEPHAMRQRSGDNESSTFGPISKSLARRVMSEGQALLVADDAGEDDADLSESVFDFPTRSMMCAPLMGPARRALGILHVDTRDGSQPLTGDDLEVLSCVATIAGQWVENARTYEARLRNDRQQRELAMARQMQLHFLPQRRPQLAGYGFFDYYRPANEVGGDYYDYISLPDGRLGLAVGDVSGKGVSAALLMSRLCSETRSCLHASQSAAEAVERLNRGLFEPLIESRFITFVLCLIDPQRHTLSLVNAGHMPPVLRHGGRGDVEVIGVAQKGLPLGVESGRHYEELELQLAPGDTLVVYTDGISEAANSEGKLYGNSRVRKIVKSGPPNVEALGEALLVDINQFVGAQPQSDDICLLCFGRDG